MDIEKKLAFVHKMTHLGLQHFDQGGTVLPGPTNPVNSGPVSGGLGGAIGGLLGTNSQYQAQGAPIQYGTNATQLNNSYAGVQGALNNAGNLVASTAPGINQG